MWGFAELRRPAGEPLTVRQRLLHQAGLDDELFLDSDEALGRFRFRDRRGDDGWEWGEDGEGVGRLDFSPLSQVLSLSPSPPPPPLSLPLSIV